MAKLCVTLQVIFRQQQIHCALELNAAVTTCSKCRLHRYVQVVGFDPILWIRLHAFI